MKAAIALVSILMLSSQTSAEEARQVRQGQPVAVTSDLAYLLFREDPRQGPGDFEYVLARELQKTILPLDHVAAPPQFDAQASLIRTDARYPYVNDAGQKSYLLAVPPGVYSIVAVTYKRMPAIGTCLCMGTVRFEARAGMLNDLGYLLGAIEDKPSCLPELASYQALWTGPTQRPRWHL